MSTPQSVAPSPGSYERKQLLGRFFILNWSHGSRYRLAKRLVTQLGGTRILDYGCGDATFLRSVEQRFELCVGADVDPGQIIDCRKRLEGFSKIKFLTIEELRTKSGTEAFDVVVCMEVIEHCLEAKVPGVLDDMARLVSKQGTVVISVPIEIGASLLIKEFFRGIAALIRYGHYQYKEKYSLRELLTMAFAGSRSRIVRPEIRADFAPGVVNIYHGHKGFNWRALRRQLEERFVVERTLFSPVGWLPSQVNSQAWFICRPK